MEKQQNNQSAKHRTLSFWHPAHLIATCFGVGNIPFAPGTWGSLAAFPIAIGYSILMYTFFVMIEPWAFPHAPRIDIFPASLWLTMVCIFLLPPVVFFIGTWAAHIYMKKTGKHDAGNIVIDEVAGQLLALFLTMPLTLFCVFPIDIPDFAVTSVCVSTESVRIATIPLLTFLAFRFFDIIKLWPASYFDKKVLNAWGVMLDDIMAALQAAISLYLMAFLLFFMGKYFS